FSSERGSRQGSPRLSRRAAASLRRKKARRTAMAKTSENRHVVRLQLTCVTPPHRPSDTTEVEFGLQDRHQVVHPGRLQPDGSLLYEIDVAVIHESQVHEGRLRGPYVHGTPVAPFLYLSLKRL